MRGLFFVPTIDPTFLLLNQLRLKHKNHLTYLRKTLY